MALNLLMVDMKKWILIGVLFFAIDSSAQDRIKKIDSLVSFCQDNGMFNATILVAEGGKIIYHRSVGMGDFEKEVPLDLNTAFCLGSISKQFTAFGIMLLKEQGKLEYSDTVGKIFPELPKYMHNITLKNLMQHTSGLRRTHYGDEDGLRNGQIFQNLVNAKEDALLFEPGTDFSYSNSGYMLLAMIIEKIAGQSFEYFLQQEVWSPLGMTNTFVMSADDYGKKHYAVGYDGFGNKSDFNVLTYGSNGIYSTAEDLFRWTQSLTTNLLIPFEKKAALWKPAISNDGKLLVDNSREHTWNYGFGMFVYKDELEGLIGHSGAFGGFLNLMNKDLTNNREVIVLNNNGRLLPVHEFGNAVHNILRREPYTLPKVSIDFELRKTNYDDIEGAIRHYHELKQTHPSKYKFNNEWELNALGYALMADDRMDDAIKIFKLLISEFPDRPNPRDSLGEAYYLNGQYELSIKSYKKALEIDKNYNVDWIKEMLQKNKDKLQEKKG